METTKKEMRYYFNGDERVSLTMEIGELNRKIIALEENKRLTVLKFKADIQDAQDKLSEMLGKITAGYEMREMDCKIEYHKPKKNQKTIYVIDTAEMFTEPMTNDDINLFNQFNEEEAINELDMTMEMIEEAAEAYDKSKSFPEDIEEMQSEEPAKPVKSKKKKSLKANVEGKAEVDAGLENQE